MALCEERSDVGLGGWREVFLCDGRNRGVPQGAPGVERSGEDEEEEDGVGGVRGVQEFRSSRSSGVRGVQGVQGAAVRTDGSTPQRLLSGSVPSHRLRVAYE